MASLSISKVSKSFGKTEVLKGIDLDLEDGEFLVLVGPSGCGKSTLLSLIAGLETISDGKILIDGTVVNDVHPKDRNIAMVFQSYALYPTMTVYKNITFGLEIRGLDREACRRKVEEVAQMLQIAPLLDRKPKQLSGGQRQRVAMGRALVRDPAIFLFDEPLSNLDAKLRIDMRHEIKKLHQSLGRTIVYVTHDQIEAMTLASRIAVMHQGVIQQYGTPDELYNNPVNQFVAGFMGSPPMNFVEGALVQESGGALALLVKEGSGEEDRFPVVEASESLRSYLGRPVILGVRPEALALSDRSVDAADGQRGVFTREVEVVEPTGADTMALLTLGKRQCTARLRPQDVVVAGRLARLEIDMRSACFFDPDTQKRL